MGIADARAMYPAIEIVEADPDADRRLLESLADWCDRYTPLVALDGSDGLFLDISGCAHLFGGEKSLLDDMLARFFHQGFDVRTGLASTPGAAWAAARVHGNRMVAAGEEEALLTPLPLWALRIEPAVRASLESVGLRTAGDIMAAPRAPLVRRFGKHLLVRLDQALGRLDEAVSPRLPVAPLSVERHLIEPVTCMEDIEALIVQLSGSLERDLERRGEGARSLQLLLFRVDGAVSRVSVGTSRPMREPEPIRKLFHERLAALEGDIDAGYGFDLVRLSVLAVAAFVMRQTDFSGATADDDMDLALFADRVSARLGEGAVMKTLSVESHLPERAVALVPFAREATDAARSAGRARASPTVREIWPERPIRLFRHPEPLDVPATEVPEGAPLRFRWRRTLYKVARSEGPERIAPEWWRMESDPTPGEIERGDREDTPSCAARLTRDYFRIEDQAGHRYWLFREGFHGMASHSPRWFMHGLFA